jgi:hypothetical protein
MATFIMVCFVVFVLAFVAKLIYDVQQNKKQSRTQMFGFDKDEFQKLAGITPINENDELRQILLKNNIQGDKIVEELKKEFENSEFPAPDPSIPVITAKLTTIGGDYGDSDPLASVPMSRVSKKAKQKMAEIAKQDISDTLEEKTKSIFPESVEYTDEYFKPDYSQVKPKTKKKNPKQDITGVVDDSKPFKKTRKKTTKKKKENE